MATSLSFERLQDRPGFLTLRDEWLALMESVQAQRFYQHPAWFTAFFEREADLDDRIDFFAARRGGKLVAVLPIAWSRTHGIVQAGPPLAEGLYMPDWAIADDEDNAEIWRCLSSELKTRSGQPWDAFAVHGALEHGAIDQCLGPQPGLVRRREARCAVIDIIQYQEALRLLKKKFRGNLNNARHRLADQSSAEFLRIADRARIGWAFDEFVALESAGWKGKPGQPRPGMAPPAAISLKPAKLNFYRNIVHQFNMLDAVEICLLRVNEKTIGGQILLLLNDTSYLLKTAFDEDARGFSPGHMLIDFAYRRYAEQGTIKKLVLISDYEWFKYWNPRYLNYLTIRAFNRTVRGLSASAVYKTKRLFSNDK